MSNLTPTTDFDAPALVVFGLDDARKPHASFFIESEAALAARAAAVMGMKLLPVKTEADRALAERLPKGRIFASGRAFVPFAKAALFTQLEAAASKGASAELQAPPDHHNAVANAKSVPSEAPEIGSAEKQETLVPQPAHWSEIKAGAIVLAAAPTDADWYECQVLSVEGDGHFTLRYCQWPNEPVFNARVADVALLHPSHTPERPLTLEQAASLAA